VRIACQTISGAYFNTAAQSLFANTIYKRTAVIAPEISPSSISKAGVSGLRKAFNGQELTLLLEAYMAGIKNVFIFAIAAAAASVLVALMIPRTRLPAHEEKTDDENQPASAGMDQ
jgi:hypothetical protein